MEKGGVMKLVIAIVNDDDVSILLKELVKANFRSTKLSTTGGFLRSGNTTLLIGVEADRLDDLVHVIETSCKTRKETVTTPPMLGEGSLMSMPIEISVGGATMFVIDVEKYIKL